MRVKPTTKGTILRDPKTKRLLPDEGGNVPDSRFWRRRLVAKEVELVADEDPLRAGTFHPDMEPVTPLTTRGGRLPLPAPTEHTERRGVPDAGGDDDQ
jgi:hypothetical protein